MRRASRIRTRKSPLAQDAPRGARRGRRRRGRRGGARRTRDRHGPRRPVDAEIDRRLDPGVERVEAIEGLDRRAGPQPLRAARPAARHLHRQAERSRPALTATSNANSSPDGGPAVLSEIDAPPQRHLRLGQPIRPTIDALRQLPQDRSPARRSTETVGGVNGRSRVDLGNDLRLNAAVDLRRCGRKSAASPDAIEDVASSRSSRHWSAASASRRMSARRASASTGHVERECFGDAELATRRHGFAGRSQSTLATVELRTGYEISPALTPFVEIEVGRRDYDEPTSTAAASSARPTVSGVAPAWSSTWARSFPASFRPAGCSEDLDDDTACRDLGAHGRRGDLTGRRCAAPTCRLDGADHPRGRDAARRKRLDPLCRPPRRRARDARQPDRQRRASARLARLCRLGRPRRDPRRRGRRDLLAQPLCRAWSDAPATKAGRAHLPDRDYKTNSIFLGLKLQR